jgi:uncharacterized protein (TIGR02996 family)
MPAKKTKAPKAPTLPAADLKKHLAAIARDPASPDAYLVFSDWLQSLGHAWGRLIAVQHALGTQKAAKKRKVLEKDAAALLDEEDAVGVKKLALAGARFTWRRGFIDTAQVHATNAADMVKGVKALFKLPAAKTVTGLFLDAQPFALTTYRNWGGSRNNIVEGFWKDVLAALPDEIPAHVTRVSLGASPPEAGTAYVRMPDFAAASKALRAVETLEVAGAGPEKTKPFNLSKLKSLSVRFGEGDDTGLRAIADSKLPALEHLSVWLGGQANCILDDAYEPEEYDEDREDEHQLRYPESYPASVLSQLVVHAQYGGPGAPSVSTFLASKVAKSVKSLGLQSAILIADMAQAIVDAKLLKGLEKLDLSGARFDEEGAALFIKNKKVFAHLQEVDFSRAYIPAKHATKLPTAFPNGVFTEKQSGGLDFFMRYVATME